MIKLYFRLQFILLKRKLKKATDINPVIIFIVLTVAFYYFSVLIFKKLIFNYALLLYFAFALWALIKNQKLSKINFLKINLIGKDYLQINLIENILICIPFVTYLFYSLNLKYGFLLFIVSILFSFFPKNQKLNFVIPTPFKNYPFEFIIGFRKNFYIFIVIIIVFIQSIIVENENLGLISLLTLLYTSSFFYLQPEEKYYVWVYSLSPNKFIAQKIKIALINSFIISFPLILSLIIAYPSEILLILGVVVVGMLVIITSLITKYSNYPTELNIQQLFLIAISMIIPFLIPIVFLYAFPKARKELKKILK